MTLRSIILVSLACGLAAALSATAPSMAARPEVDSAKKAVQRAVAALAQDLTSEDPAERKTARTALVQLSESVMKAVLTERRYPPAERKALADELFAGAVMAARQGQMLMSLPKDERRAVLKLAKSHAGSFNDLFSEDTDAAVDAVDILGHAEDGASQVILRWSITHPNWQVRRAALETTEALEALDKKLADAVFKRMEDLGGASEGEMYPGSSDSRGERILRQIHQEEAEATRKTLAVAKDPRVLLHLIRKLMRTRGGFSSSRDSAIALIVQMNDKRTIVTLMDCIGRNEQVSMVHYGRGGAEVTVLTGDLAMHVIIKQTGQDLADYGFYRRGEWGPMGDVQGFEDGAERRKARTKLRKWWRENKHEYEGVEKIQLPGKTRRRTFRRIKLPGFIEEVGDF